MRKDHKVSRKFEKDPGEEVFLERLNDILEPYEGEDYRELEESYPTLFIIGVPRSGTTLLSQLVSVHFDVGYIDNLIAAFWKAPVYGVRLSRKLVSNVRESSFRSRFGRTEGIMEPHEFGYFWARFFGDQPLRQKPKDFEARVDWERMRRILINISHAFCRPAVYKYLPMCYYMEAMGNILKKSCFVRVKRDPVQAAVSIYNSRKRFLDSVDEWFSLKPSQYEALKEKPVWEQVAGQVFYLETFMDEAVKKVGNNRVLDVAYGDVCRNPGEVLKKIEVLLNRNGGEVKLPSEPRGFEEKRLDIGSDEIYSKIARSVEAFENHGIHGRTRGV